MSAPAERPERTHYAKGEARRAEIIEATMRLMNERGFRSTSLRAIGRELGIQPAHILHYFGSREGLLEAVIEAWDERYLEARETENQDLFQGWLRLIRENMQAPGLVHLYTAFAAEAANPHHPSRPFFQRRWDRIRRAVEAELRRGQAEGRYVLGSTPADAAAALVTYSDGLQLHWLLNPSIDMAEAMAAAIDAFVGSSQRLA